MSRAATGSTQDSSLRSRNPFPGLRPFTRDESHLFFGRDQEVYDLLRKLRLIHFLAVVGPSGCGKSSLIKAGVLAALQDGYMADEASWRIAEFRPGTSPLGQLASALHAVLPEEPGSSPQDAVRVAKGLREGTLDMNGLIRTSQPPAGTRTLILADQFEELFQFVQRAASTEAEDEAKVFLKLLLSAAASEESSVYVVITMRSEYLGQCASYVGLAEAINEGLYLVPQMARRQLRQAIIEPIDRAGSFMTAPLLDRLLNDLNNQSDQLPVLQHALMRMWTAKTDTQPFATADYEAAGDLSTCLSRHAEEVFQNLTMRQKKIAETMFRSLAELNPGNRIVRRPSSAATICDSAGCSIDELAAVVEEFSQEGRSFLVSSSGQFKPDSVIDLSHEALARQWERIRTWVEEEARIRRVQTQLEDTAAAWQEKKRDKSFLYGGLRLAEAERLIAPRLRRIPKLAQDFLLASRKARQRRLIAKILAFSSPVLALVVLLAYAYRVEGQRADDKAKLAQLESERADSAARVAQIEGERARASAELADILVKKEPGEKTTLALRYQESLSSSNLPQKEIDSLQQKLNTAFAPRVYIHISDEHQRAAARELQRKLEAEKFEVPGIEKVNRGPDKTSVRYFLNADAADARRITNILRASGQPEALPVYVTSQKSHEALRPRSFEIWYAHAGVTATLPPIVSHQELTAPNPLATADGSVFHHFPRTTKLEWAAVAGAKSYTVEIDCMWCCGKDRWCADVGKPFRIIPNLTETKFSFDFVGAQPGRWRVWAVSSDGIDGPKSRWSGFRYTR